LLVEPRSDRTAGKISKLAKTADHVSVGSDLNDAVCSSSGASANTDDDANNGRQNSNTMKPVKARSMSFNQRNHRLIAYVAAASLSFSSAVFAQQTAQSGESQVATTTTSAAAESPKIPNDQLDSLVAPIALYPDPLLAQTLAASTYPLEIIELHQWMKKNPNLKDKAFADAVARQPWDPSVQSMAAFPDVVKQLSDKVAWSSDLGNAYLAQPADVMVAVQRMRAKAQKKGSLKTSAQQKVETEPVEGGGDVIMIEQADPDLIYVPSYNPTVVYGEAPDYSYPYPSVYYPPPYEAGLAFGAGIALGAAAWGGWWGDCNWHGNGDVTINNKNNFNKNSNINRQGGKWQHNPQHRGNAPYGDRGTANKYGGRARERPMGATNRPSGGARVGAGGGFASGAGNRAGGGPGAGAGNVGAGNRPSGGTGRGGNTGAMSRPGGASKSARSSTGVSSGFGGGGNSIGNHGISSGGGFGSSSNAFGGGGFSGSSARSASSRGGYSMSGGGFSGGGHGGGGHGGGGHGGGGRGGGGRGGGGGGRR
jgi:hypothetical protein